MALVTFDEEAPQALAEYLRGMAPLLERAGARLIRRIAVNRMMLGPRPAQSVLLVEYPNRAAVDLVLKSPDYRRLATTRQKAFLEYEISIAGE